MSCEKKKKATCLKLILLALLLLSLCFCLLFSQSISYYSFDLINNHNYYWEHLKPSSHGAFLAGL